MKTLVGLLKVRRAFLKHLACPFKLMLTFNTKTNAYEVDGIGNIRLAGVLDERLQSKLHLRKNVL
jgi:hypothetical protein